jgi:hypothetical protein
MSKVSISNKALTLVGASPITSLTDESENARAINRVYSISLKSALSETMWNFATKRVLLAQVDVTLAWSDDDDTYVYQRPSDVIRIFSTNDEDSIWYVEGDYIISDTSGLGIKYVYYNDSPSTYSASFKEAFTDKLASDIAFMILNSSEKANSMLEKYERVSLPKARSENAQVGRKIKLKDDAWENAKDGAFTDC